MILADRAGVDRVPKVRGMHANLLLPRLPGLLWERFALGRTLRPGDLLFAPTNLIPSGWSGPTVLVMFDALQEVRPGDFSRGVRLRFGRRYRKAVSQADRVIVPSEATAADLIRVYGLPRERMTVIHPAPDPAFRPLGPDAIEVHEARRFLTMVEADVADHGAAGTEARRDRCREARRL